MTTNMLVEALTIDVDKLDLDQEDRLRSPVSMTKQGFEVDADNLRVK